MVDKQNLPSNNVAKALGIALYSNKTIKYALLKLIYYFENNGKNQHFYTILHEATRIYDFYGIDIQPDMVQEINTLEDYW